MILYIILWINKKSKIFEFEKKTKKLGFEFEFENRVRDIPNKYYTIPKIQYSLPSP